MIGIKVNSAASNADRLAHQPLLPPDKPGAPHLAEPMFDPLITAFVDPAWRLFMITAATVGAIAVFGECSTGLIRTTFAAVPDRKAAIAAKLTGRALTLGQGDRKRHAAQRLGAAGDEP
ncbi:hypothetical protein ACWCQW_39440 [Streptomyces mirabilis]